MADQNLYSNLSKTYEITKQAVDHYSNTLSESAKQHDPKLAVAKKALEICGSILIKIKSVPDRLIITTVQNDLTQEFSKLSQSIRTMLSITSLVNRGRVVHETQQLNNSQKQIDICLKAILINAHLLNLVIPLNIDNQANDIEEAHTQALDKVDQLNRLVKDAEKTVGNIGKAGKNYAYNSEAKKNQIAFWVFRVFAIFWMGVIAGLFIFYGNPRKRMSGYYFF